MKNILWKIYYDDGFVLDGYDDTQLPKDRRLGVVVIADIDSKHGRQIWKGFDWYYYKNDLWYGADLQGMLDQIMHFLDQIKWVIQGRMVTHSDYEKIQIACEQYGLPAKTGKRVIEGL